VIAPDVIQPSSEYSQQTKGAIGAASFEHAALLVDAEFHPALEHPHELRVRMRMSSHIRSGPTIMPFWPASTRRVIFSLIFSSDAIL
jgi:hypothetical protein